MNDCHFNLASGKFIPVLGINESYFSSSLSHNYSLIQPCQSQKHWFCHGNGMQLHKDHCQQATSSPIYIIASWWWLAKLIYKEYTT